MSAAPVLTFVIVGGKDQPLYEVDFTGPKEVCLNNPQVRTADQSRHTR